ncbi:cobalamin-binding protein [Castellaniella sp.]|uniref:cobalamin-binding protein n=1 Tax=Castellaniella sp. TaxID=1955812 RepID=UPI003C72ED05
MPIRVCLRKLLPLLLLCLPLQGVLWVAPAHATQDHTPRIITLAPHATELVFAAGAGADIVATVQHSNYPAAAQHIPRVGNGFQYSAESILVQHPTLVIAWYPTDASRALADTLGRLDIPLIYANPQTLEDIPALIRHLGARLGTQARARQTASALEARIARLQPLAPPAPTVFIEISADPLFTLGNDPLVNNMLSHCGASNLYGSRRIAAPQVSLESVLHLNPDALILSPPDPASGRARAQWWARHGLEAARAGHVYTINPDWLHRPGPRLIDAAETLCHDLQGLRAAAQ